MKQKMRRWSASFFALLLCMTLLASTGFAAGGALGAEGCVWLAVSGTDEQIAGVRALVKELSGEPATEL